jgi:imidazolonepropionase-like amidohydrolase
MRYEVLQTATINPARALGLDAQIGSLKVGKLADLIFYVSNSPLSLSIFYCMLLKFKLLFWTIILDTANIQWVMKNGYLYEASTMDQILPTLKARAPLPQLNLFTVN